MLLRDQVLQLQRRYKYITKDLCFYNDKSELKRNVNIILVWALVSTESQGHFVAKIKFTSRRIRAYKEWVDYWNNPQKAVTKDEKMFLKKVKRKMYPAIHDVLKNKLVPAMGSKYGEEWELREVIGWTMNIHERGINK